jgi:hypothetical protein
MEIEMSKGSGNGGRSGGSHSGGGKAVGHPAIAVVKETAVDGPVEQATDPEEGAATHQPAVAKVGWGLN